LAEENTELRDLKMAYYKKSFDNTIVVNDSAFDQEFTFMKAKVIRNSTTRRNNYLTLNRGAKHGIKAGMGVISAKGVIGIVLETSEDFSAVMSILNSESKISAKIEKNDYFGSAIWEGKNYRHGLLKDIPDHVSLVEGDLIVSSGYSGIFPEAVPLGKVLTVERKAGSGFLDVEFEYTEDYRNLSFVHVVKYLQKEERELLESKISSDD
jgi:rod shape-determining protein MreC